MPSLVLDLEDAVLADLLELADDAGQGVEDFLSSLVADAVKEAAAEEAEASEED